MIDIESAAFWNRRYADVDSVWSNSPNQFVVESLSELPPGRMIDLAGGEGRNSLWFARRGWQAENVEISSVAVQKFLQRAANEGLSDRVMGTIREAGKPADYRLAPADLGLIAYLQLPNEQLRQNVAELTEALAPGATLFGVWHAKENLVEGFGGPQSDDVLPTVGDLLAIAKLTGLSVITCELRERVVSSDGTERRAIDVLLHSRVAN